MARKTRNDSPEGGTPPHPRNNRRTAPTTAPTTAPDTAPGADFPMGHSIQDAPGEDFDQVHQTAPVTPSAHLLSPNHQRFCAEYVQHLNGTKAYLAAYPECDPESARTCASRLLASAHVRAHIQALLDERATVSGITADRVLVRLWEQATADPNELVEVRIGACRHCWGLYHQYQYTDAEWEQALSDHVHAEKKRAKAEKDDFVPKHCPEKGGTGYTPNRPPNPECPECHGDGEPRSIIKDTARASPGARALYGGVKYDKNGNLTVIVRDQLPALRMVAEHLGLLSDKLPGPAMEVDPLMALLLDIRGRHGAGTALAVVHQDPEARRPAGEVQDVQAKTAPGAVSRNVSRPPAGKWRPTT